MNSRIVVSLRIAASPEVVFDAFVDDIAVWWRPNGLFAFTPRSPGVMAFEDGRLVERLPNGKVFEVGVVSVWERGARLVFGWRQAAFTPDMNTEVEVRFEAVGEGTRVTVEHRGWDSVPAPHVARHGFPNAAFLARHGEWWRNLLAGLAARANSVHLGAGDEGLS
ncbi:SRPBCC domain-containing protein [Caulobacter vibrioides]|uniref:Ligand-binding SRPBCC domain protein n=1 Tax=Caulobacter vibrioides (strain NA1000 / CB15N) TaxID=565050 RepID=A0A0H3IA75_CAUVN|nr:SRPBCC domain-containing protein [Caulobacter vibrioides]YP_008877607.1 ligand-binding SRPBCC domain protein [Caulobacter vibrioides NA1000]AGJ94606.1 ligand-binding SRPBCC domain protein [Caulobacter vibrioides NA1000]QXZ53361.1 SRPBCC domain-containing protein [Caulobacter vibrioides]